MRSFCNAAYGPVGAIAMVAALVSGCGAEGSPTTSPPGPPSSTISTDDADTTTPPTDPVRPVEDSTRSTTIAPVSADAGEEADSSVFGEAPPPVVIRGGGRLLELDAWTTCWMPLVDDGNESVGYCADGAPPDELELIESDEPLTVMFPIDTWEFSATATVATALTAADRESDVVCGRSQTESLEPLGDGSWQLPLIGPAGDQTVTIFGGGPGGDVFVTFRWLTTVEGVLPIPDATVSVLAQHDDELDSYGVELLVNDLSEAPADATARITVISASGASRVIEPALEDLGCGWEGQLFFRAAADDGRLDSDLADGPFTYTVDVTLDGVVHRATAIWPDDEDEQCAPCVPLTFEPPLPALEPAG